MDLPPVFDKDREGSAHLMFSYCLDVQFFLWKDQSEVTVAAASKESLNWKRCYPEAEAVCCIYGTAYPRSVVGFFPFSKHKKMDVTKGYSMPLLNIFFQVFFLQQIFFGLYLVSSSQVVGQHEPDVENKGMSWCSKEMFLEGFVTFESWIMHTEFWNLFCEINILGNTSPFLTFLWPLICQIHSVHCSKPKGYKMGKVHFRKTGVVLI